MKQIGIPFSIGPDGTVDYVTDPIQSLADRVRALASTSPGERVMRATFGVETLDLVFDWDATVGQMQLQQRVQEAVSLWEPSARVLNAEPVMNPDGSEVMGVNVDISAGDPITSGGSSAQYSVTITATGDIARSV